MGSSHTNLFVGRDAELAELTAALDGAAQGHGTVRLLLGEPGIGKTRLADELSHIANARGFRVAWGRCWEAGGAPPLWPWRELLRELGGEASVSIDGDSDAARFKRFEAVAAVLTKAPGPLLLVLDDLHAVDTASLELLLFFARRLRTLPVLLIGTAREVETRLRPHVQSMLDRVAREGRSVPLRRLAPEAVAQLAQGVARRPLEAPVLDRVFHLSEGNPLFVDELARLIDERGRLDDLALPGSGRGMLAARLSLLPVDVRAVAEAASIFGREFDVRLLELLGPFPAAREALETCVTTGLIAPVTRTSARFAFTHILIQEALYQQLPAARRAQLHQTASTLISPTSTSELAHHALLGAACGEATRAVDLARTAARTASNAGSFDFAASLLERALEVAGPSAAPELRADLLIDLAESQARNGQSARSRETAAKALETARNLSDATRLARAALAMGFTTTLGMVNPVLVRALREALAAIGQGEPGLRARLNARLASALQPANAPDEPINLALEAVALARTTDDATLLATLYSACSAMGDLADPIQRAPLNDECARLAARLGDSIVAQRAQARLAIDLVELGEFARADGAIVEAERLGRELGSPTYRWRPLLLRSMRALMHGRFAESEHLVSEVAGLASDVDDFDVQVALTNHRLGACLVSGRYAAASALHEQFQRLIGSLEYGARFATILRLLTAVHSGDLAAIRPDEVESLEGAVVGATKDDLQLLSAISDGAAATSPSGVTDAIYSLAARHEAREPTTGMMGLVYIAPFHATLALLASASGRGEVALRHFRLAVERCAKLALRPLEAHLLAERSVLFDVLGRAEQARVDRERARMLAQELGIETLSKVLATRRALGLSFGVVDTPPAPPSTLDFTLTHEGDVWAVARGGRTFRLKHTRGLEMLAVLIAHPGHEVHSTELDLPGVEVDSGDAGAVFDAKARDAFRARAKELEVELQEAMDFNDPGRVEVARAELEQIAEQLASGVGLGGRERRQGSRVERSRVNVQRRLKDVVKRFSEHDLALARHLERSLKTGTFCSYEP